ncbi:hypothetical protein V6N11_029466 [Hibiscus sabdariffa]|uniref:COP1-interacting protein 7 n=1 Tax=Hibiscus sabdariffa TaxID=183260 RepID=A0ABR2P6W6_9ROSI
MKSSARLDSVVFQLTPTRTRFDLVISANGKTEKMASGLLNPFLAHLKTAQVQMSQGGYSIILKPEPAIDASWFTKGTVGSVMVESSMSNCLSILLKMALNLHEKVTYLFGIQRFLRLVSTPEILERVYSVESEILQIEEAIAIQSNNNTGLSAVEEHRVKPVESTGTEVNLYVCLFLSYLMAFDRQQGATPDSYDEKAIVLYSPSALCSEANASSVEGNSKAQLLKVLETRKTVLQKEQSMAFARAVAAGFDIDHMAPLISFAETSGASRFRDACIKFTELWKRKHETGQWLEIDAAEAMSSRSDFPAMNATGIVFLENNGKSGVESSTDEKPSMDQQTPVVESLTNLSIRTPCFLPGLSIHHRVVCHPFKNILCKGCLTTLIILEVVHSFSNLIRQQIRDTGKRIQKRHSMESRESHSGSDTWEMEREKPQDNEELENGTSLSPKPRKKSSRENSSGSDSQSHSGSEEDVEDGDTEHKYSRKYSKANESRKKSVDAYDREETVNGKEMDGGHWQAFQNYLLRDAEDEECRTDQEMFSTGKEVQGMRRPSRVHGSEDLLVFGGREMSQFKEGNAADMHEISASGSRLPKSSNDQSLTIARGGHPADGGRIFIDGEMDGRIACRRTINDEFILDRQQNLSDFTNSPSDPQAFIRLECSSNGLERSSNDINDDSYIVPFRSTSVTQVGTDDRRAINMDSDFSLSLQKAENIPNSVGSHANYEPDGLSLMPERGGEMGSIGYDPALDYEMQVCVEDGTSLVKKNKEGMQGSKKSEKDQKSKLIADPSDKKKAVGPIRRGKHVRVSVFYSFPTLGIC